MALYHGVAINFGVSSSLSGLTGVMQTIDHNVNTSNEEIRNGSGEFVQKTLYGIYEEATFEVVAGGGAGPAGNAAVVFPDPGVIGTVIDTQYTEIAGTNWILDSVSVKGSNTTAKRITCKLWRASGIAS